MLDRLEMKSFKGPNICLKMELRHEDSCLVKPSNRITNNGRTLLGLKLKSFIFYGTLSLQNSSAILAGKFKNTKLTINVDFTTKIRLEIVILARKFKSINMTKYSYYFDQNCEF